MAEYKKETVITQSNTANPMVKTQTVTKATNTQTAEYVIYFIFGAIEILLGFRLVLKIAGASLSSSFVEMIYGITRIFILPFEGIFHRGINQGVETTSVFEPSTLVALIVYSILAWGIVKLVRVLSGEEQKS